MCRRVKRTRKLFFLLKNCFSSISVVFFVIVIVQYLNLVSSTSLERENEQESFRRLTYWGMNFKKWNPKGSLRTMNRVFRKLSYKFVNASNGDDWDVMWSIQYPFIADQTNYSALLIPMENFVPKPKQRINHFPWIHTITNKKNLGLKTKSKYLLPTFTFPADEEKFKKFTAAYPRAKFVTKNYNNRGVRVLTVDDFDKSDKKKIFQVFLDKPFLIDGHAFDFGVYVLISSMNPLRIYRYDHEVFIRFCPEEYHPFDANERKKYVVEDNHKSVYDMPSFKRLYDEYRFPFKTIFEYLIESKGGDVKALWEKIDDAIVSIILQNERKIVKKIYEYGFNTTTHFFELVRFDIVFDSKLKPYVMEINMSPNLTPAKDEHEEYALIYEQLVYNTLNLVGAGTHADFVSRFRNDTTAIDTKNVATNYEACVRHNCAENCDNPECLICLPCVHNLPLLHINEAHHEHMRRGNFKRVFPSSPHYKRPKLFQTLWESNKIMMRWFEAKCESDESWC